MIRNIKALGLALVGMMALSGVAASAAQAQIHVRTEGNAIVTSDETLVQHVLRLGTAEVKCQEATLEGTITGSNNGQGQTTTSDTLVTTGYGGCQFLGEAATVQMNGCKYTLQETATALRSTIQIAACTTGKQITVQSAACQLHLPEQAALDHAVFSNRENAPRKHDIEVNTTLTPITGIQKRGLFCPSAQQASLSGETTIQAYEDTATQQQLTVQEHQFTRHICGSEVGVLAT